MIARANDDEISLENFLERQRIDLGSRTECYFLDPDFFKFLTDIDFMLPREHIAIFELHEETRIREGHGHHFTPYIQDFGCFLYSPAEITGNFFQSRQKNIAKAMPLKATLGKTIVH